MASDGFLGTLVTLHHGEQVCSGEHEQTVVVEQITF